MIRAVGGAELVPYVEGSGDVQSRKQDGGGGRVLGCGFVSCCFT